MYKLIYETLELQLQEYAETPSLKLLYDKKSKTGLVEAIAPYIPMDEFMSGFNKATEMIKDEGLKNLIFDKRALRAFHQPSMEWYFVQWKPKVRDLGLKNHFKILPEEDWFRSCVEAGKNEIRQRYPENLLSGITITYTETVAEAFDKITNANRAVV
ncbi:MAG: hypothetical protein GC178_15460 [Flavobacteriales bacterium]|nr:hypothetical protein [Flavobacteriales bacterium]